MVVRDSSFFSVSCLGLYVWGEGLPDEGKYFMYLSRVMDHTPWYVIAVMEDIAKRLGTTSDVETELAWTDLGTHFRCYRFWAYWLGYVPLTRNVKTGNNCFPGGHGKTRLDGAFGRRQRWTLQMALRQVISSEVDLTDMLNGRARKAREQNPLSPETEFILFTPPSKKELFQKTTDLAPQARRHLCPHAHGIRKVAMWALPQANMRSVLR